VNGSEDAGDLLQAPVTPGAGRAMASYRTRCLTARPSRGSAFEVGDEGAALARAAPRLAQLGAAEGMGQGDRRHRFGRGRQRRIVDLLVAAEVVAVVERVRSSTSVPAVRLATPERPDAALEPSRAAEVRRRPPSSAGRKTRCFNSRLGLPPTFPPCSRDLPTSDNAIQSNGL
jgi:hypothetical protein